MAAGLTALSATLMALISREASGKGDYIDCAMFDSLLPWCVHTAGSAIAGGPAPVSGKQRSLGGAGFYQVYVTSDAKYVVLGGREIGVRQNLLNALDYSSILIEHRREAGDRMTYRRIESVFITRSRDEMVARFADKDVAFAPVLDFREALDEPHVAERGLWVEHDGAHHIAPAIRFASEQWQPSKAPELDADGD